MPSVSLRAIFNDIKNLPGFWYTIRKWLSDSRSAAKCNRFHHKQTDRQIPSHNLPFWPAEVITPPFPQNIVSNIGQSLIAGAG